MAHPLFSTTPRRMDAAAVTEIVNGLRSGNPNKGARIRMAEVALQYTRDLTDCGRAVWQEFLDAERAS